MDKKNQAKALRVVENITNALSDEALAEEEVYIIIKARIKEGYNDAGPQIFNSLSLIFHPDKTARTSSPLLEYFKRNQLQLDLQNIVNEVKSEINEANNELAKEIAAKKKLQYSSSDGFNRYVQPFRFIVNAIYWLVVFTLFLSSIPLILVSLGLLVVTNVIDSISNFLVHLLAGIHYNLLLKQYQEEHFEYYKKSYLSEYRKKANLNLGFTPQQLAELSDEDFFDIYIQTQVNTKSQSSGFTELDQAQYKQSILDIHNIEINKRTTSNNFNRFMLAFRALYADVTQPLDRSADLLIRAIKVLISPSILLFVAFNDLLNLSVNKGTILVAQAVKGVYIATVYVLNSPFFVYDYIKPSLRINSLSSKNSDREEAIERLHDVNNPLRRVIQYPGRQNDLEHEELAQHGSLFNSRSSELRCAHLEIDEPDTSLYHPD
ncbi:MAG: hypothetical protein P4L65_08265 [Legionella sp.]|nr:hypothetical protein [Legionella sp.]